MEEKHNGETSHGWPPDGLGGHGNWFKVAVMLCPHDAELTVTIIVGETEIPAQSR